MMMCCDRHVSSRPLLLAASRLTQPYLGGGMGPTEKRKKFAWSGSPQAWLQLQVKHKIIYPVGSILMKFTLFFWTFTLNFTCLGWFCKKKLWVNTLVFCINFYLYRMVLQKKACCYGKAKLLAFSFLGARKI